MSRLIITVVRDLLSIVALTVAGLALVATVAVGLFSLVLHAVATLIW